MAYSIVQTTFSSTATAALSSALICRKTVKHASTLFRFSSSLLSVRSYNSLSTRKSLSETLSPINHPATMKTMSSSLHTSVPYDGSFNLPPSTAPWLSITSPWLMLPPAFTGKGELVYRFYSLGENQVMTLERGDREFWPDDGYSIIGSSHGWLFLFHKKSCALLLSNPLYGRHVRLPSIRSLPHIPKTHLDRGLRSLHDVIISSSSPDDDDECRAVVTFGPHRRLAFCCPNSKGLLEWTLLGDKTCYNACVYSAKQKLFFCLRDGYYERDHEVDYDDDDEVEENEEEEDEDPRLEAWDLRDPHSPRMIPMPVSFDKKNYPIAYRSEQEHKQKKHPSIRDVISLAVAETTGQLFHVRRFNKEWVGAHGYYAMDEYYGPKIGLRKAPPYTTVGFDVHRYDPETGSLVYMDRSLDGLALFIGSNNGFGLPAADFPELTPHAIYYTEPPKWDIDEVDIFNHDVGIFSYRDETFTPCFYPVDVQSSVRVSGPKWFTPTPVVRFPFLVQNDDGTLSYGSSCSSIPPTKSHSQN
ncbi:Unknown protein [Striga hermonthica]|uniref:KIB1-4 beta-propeller domain-containing protein n=1 Tax=Striga hermonthica TaxID=68872 RepID=A0A9N7N7S1_STRHE|nr:Unknown protein [Striga hermonthica]